MNSTIQNYIACLTHGCPSDDNPQDWYDAVILCNENCIANAALLDSGATGLFIDPDFIQSKHLAICPLLQAIPVYNVDGSPNEGGAIREVIYVVL